MKTIKAKQTIAGSYGVLNVDDTTEVTDKVAEQLKDAGLADIVGEGGQDKEEDKPDTSVNITDNTSKGEKKEVLVKDEKKADAGPDKKKDDAGLADVKKEDKKK